MLNSIKTHMWDRPNSLAVLGWSLGQTPERRDIWSLSVVAELQAVLLDWGLLTTWLSALLPCPKVSCQHGLARLRHWCQCSECHKNSSLTADQLITKCWALRHFISNVYKLINKQEEKCFLSANMVCHRYPWAHTHFFEFAAELWGTEDNPCRSVGSGGFLLNDRRL